MRGLKIIALGCISFVMLGCQVKSEKISPIKLSGSEVSSLFTGKTVESFNLVNGSTSFTYYAPDGGVYQERYWEARTGQWKINENAEVCLSMKGKPFSCRAIYRTDEKYYKYRLNDEGQMEKIIRYRQFIDGKVF